LEITEGYLLIVLHGRNVAWNYADDLKLDANFKLRQPSVWNAWWCGEDTFFHGNIKLKYFGLWWVVGGIMEAGYFVLEVTNGLDSEELMRIASFASASLSQ